MLNLKGGGFYKIYLPSQDRRQRVVNRVAQGGLTFKSDKISTNL